MKTFGRYRELLTDSGCEIDSATTLATAFDLLERGRNPQTASVRDLSASPTTRGTDPNLTLFHNVAFGIKPTMGMAEKRILLVEDEPQTAQILEHVLWTEGYHIDVASTVAEAIRFLDTSTYALVIADWRLPDGNGLLIADMGADIGAKTVVMSGYLFQMSGGRADRHETVMKPLRPAEIVEFVERLIGKPWGA